MKQGFLKGLNAAYQRSMQQRPVLTLFCVNGTLACVSDCLAQNLPALLGDKKAQKIAEKQLAHSPSANAIHKQELEKPGVTPPLQLQEDKGYDFVRTLRLAAYNGSMAPLVQQWFLALDRTFPLPSGATTGAASTVVMKRVFADQLVFAPIGLAAFFGVMAALEGKDIKQRFNDAYVPALIANYKVWPLAQLINFRFCPPAYRVPFLGTLGIFWTAYLSWLNAAAEKEEELVIQK